MDDYNKNIKNITAKVNQILDSDDTDKILKEIDEIIRIQCHNNGKIEQLEFLRKAYLDEIHRLDDYNQQLEQQIFVLKLSI